MSLLGEEGSDVFRIQYLFCACSYLDAKLKLFHPQGRSHNLELKAVVRLGLLLLRQKIRFRCSYDYYVCYYGTTDVNGFLQIFTPLHVT